MHLTSSRQLQRGTAVCSGSKGKSYIGVHGLSMSLGCLVCSVFLHAHRHTHLPHKQEFGKPALGVRWWEIQAELSSGDRQR